MCTLDIMGYTNEQFQTIPFLVYLKALSKKAEDPSKEVNHKVCSLIGQTCIKILEVGKNFKDQVCSALINFVNQEGKTS